MNLFHLELLLEINHIRILWTKVRVEKRQFLDSIAANIATRLHQ